MRFSLLSDAAGRHGTKGRRDVPKIFDRYMNGPGQYRRSDYSRDAAQTQQRSVRADASGEVDSQRNRLLVGKENLSCAIRPDSRRLRPGPRGALQPCRPESYGPPFNIETGVMFDMTPVFEKTQVL